MSRREIASEEHQSVFSLRGVCCPKCSGTLEAATTHASCRNCGQSFPVTNNIPQLFWPTEWDGSKRDVTEEIKSFYEKSPFPNYDDFDSIGSLVEKARKRGFAKLLDEQIPYGARIIECGCGTGQLSSFLSVAGRTVVGADLCLNSLSLAQGFKEKNALKRAHFVQMNLFRPCFVPGSFDLVISNGVLHHTSDPYLGFESIARLVRPKGYIMIGLYHKYGRFTTDMRRLIFRISGGRLQQLDPRLREQQSDARKIAWFMDQYKNPHESKHTIGEVLKWLPQNGFSFVRSIPKAALFDSFKVSESLFGEEQQTNALSRFIAEVGMMVTASKDGGLFIVIAQKAR